MKRPRDGFVSRISYLVSRAREIRFTRYASRTWLALFGIALIGGCRAAAKVSDVPRVDLQLEGGNRGYLVGTPRGEATLKPTRQVLTADVEIPSWYKAKPSGTTVGLETGAPEGMMAESAQAAGASMPAHDDTYVVKPGESLWTIAAKPEIYGKSTRWRRIFDANRDVLKSPNHVRPGMTLKIPRGDSGPAATRDDEGTTFRK